MDTSTSPTSSTSSSSAHPPIQPLRNPKYRHISKSAAKRESVQMLGSIRDLQRHFASGGKVEHRPGLGVGLKGISSLGSLGEDAAEGEENRPPSALSDRANSHSNPHRRPYKELELPRIDIEDARREAKSIIEDVRGIWGLSVPISPTTAASSGLPSSKSLYFPINFDGDEETHGEMRTSEDIQNALVQTAQSIRRIRFLALSISHNSSGRKTSGSGSGSAFLQARLGGAGKLRSSLSTPSRPTGAPLRTISNPAVSTSTERKASLGKSDGDVLGELRKAALEVLTHLRELEERLRVDRSDTPTQERPFSPETEGTSGSGDPDGSGSGIFSEPENYDSEEDELYNPNNLASTSENTSHLTNWEDRILSEKREYRDLDDNAWEKEARGARDGMGRWVGVVEQLFVFTPDNGERELEDWAKDWSGRQLERLHSFLLSNLPLDLALRLPSTTSSDFESSILSRLSDGYILIHAYNSSLLKSTKPWGFIPDEDVHDTLSSTISSGHTSPSKGSTAGQEEGRKEKEWTFRRVGNLTCFAAALKHRYQLPIQLPLTNLPVPAIPPKSSARPRARPSINTSVSANGTTIKAEDKIEFDPMVIAKKNAGWEAMLGDLIQRWLGAVIKEIRDVHEKSYLSNRGSVDRGGMI